ncbi:hypothetical protein COY27_03385 [Candidatus Woesearchaeota archaeon CG_4_10_14_0_2_um_filter_33_13]|nr:MAG: hypothetical protein COY27_03385 [Candidatus Woesearchaeota archaeon CG_4_10_14_0_2_um_filter_33_13]
MDFNQLQVQLNKKLNEFNLILNNFFNFVLFKLKNFKSLSLGEQISYALIGCGFFLLLISIVMFLIM